MLSKRHTTYRRSACCGYACGLASLHTHYRVNHNMQTSSRRSFQYILTATYVRFLPMPDNAGKISIRDRYGNELLRTHPDLSSSTCYRHGLGLSLMTAIGALSSVALAQEASYIQSWGNGEDTTTYTYTSLAAGSYASCKRCSTMGCDTDRAYSGPMRGTFSHTDWQGGV